MILLVLLLVFLLLFLIGALQILNALWELREGSSRSAYLRKGMVGAGLIGLAIILQYIGGIVSFNF